MIDRLRLKYPKLVVVSALQKEGFGELMEMMMQEISSLRQIVQIKIPQSDYALVAIIKREGKILQEEYEENNIHLKAEIPMSLMHKLLPYKYEPSETDS